MRICSLQSLLLAAACALLISANLASAQLENYINNECSEDGNYTSNSTYRANLHALLTAMSSDQDITYGFYNFSQGQDPDRVYGIALCRGDISLAACRACLNFSTADILDRCPTQKEAIVWYDHCMLRYSNRSTYGTFVGRNYFSRWVQDARDTELLNRHLYSLLYRLRDQAAAGNSTRKFAIGHSNATDFGVIYALVQCTPDLSYTICGNCLDFIFTYIDLYLGGNQRGSSYGPNCGFRYSLEQFYETGASAAPPMPPTIVPPQLLQGDTDRKTVIVAIVATALCFVTLLVSICILLSWRHRRQNVSNDVEDIRMRKSLQYDLSTIRLATGDFSEENKLGKGGFGSVYKGKLEDGEPIAVKRLAAGSRQGDAEFKNEVMLVAKLRHRNLVQLLGFCLEGSERLLIYEFMPNTSLDQLLFDACRSVCLDWEKRFKIIEGVARGLLYLHEDSRLRIIHRDLKASNILLDQDLRPKIADFGTARLFGMDETKGLTSHVVGTYGYMAPEYVMRGQFSTKSDVYSFGILMLELLSGQRKTGFCIRGHAEDLVTYGWECWSSGRVTEMVDQSISKGGGEDEMRRCLQIGLLCVQESAAARPTMATVVLMLSSYLLALPLPPKPAFSAYNSSVSGMTTASENVKSS
uniref:Uncharacterized protein n=1 Tax=Kalanchoe fedtschenkoi TaxID=63787 RepID=A0A7N0ZW27_KALFE